MQRRNAKLRESTGDRVFMFFVYFIAIFMMLLIIYPLWFIVIASFSNPADVARGEVWLWPKTIVLDGYREIFKQPAIWTGYRNTVIYTLVGTFIALAVNVPAGYALSRKDLLGRKWILWIYVVPMFFSGGLIPTYFTIRNFGLYDSFWVMVLPFSVACYNIVIIRTFFTTSLPEELWEAAQLDGCGTVRFFLQMVLPLSKAILAVIGLWTAVGHWNAWFNAMIYLRNTELHSLQLILRRVLISNESLLGAATGNLASELRALSDMMKYAAIIVSTLPIMCLYPFLQKHFNKGVMIGSIKG